MQQFPAYFFPDTIATPATVLPLVPVFQPLVYWQPVESETAATEIESQLGPLVSAGTLRFEVPAPLGERRSAFLHLLANIQDQGQAFREQMTALSLAGLGQAQPESRTGIVNTLTADDGPQTDQTEAQLLWQARLLLKLAEISRQEREELDARFQAINAREAELLRQLKSDDDEGLFQDLIPTLTPASRDMSSHCLTAWTRLLTLGQVDPTGREVFLTHSREAVEQLLDAHELLRGTRTLPLTEQPLPLPAAGDVQASGEQCVLPLPLLHRLLNQKHPCAADRKTLVQEWQLATSSRSCAMGLTLFHCAGIGPRSLFVEAFDRSRRLLRPLAGEQTLIGLVA